MTTEQAISDIEEKVQWCRENGESDLRTILNFIKCLRQQHESEKFKPNKKAKVPEYDYLTEGFDPNKLPKK